MCCDFIHVEEHGTDLRNVPQRLHALFSKHIDNYKPKLLPDVFRREVFYFRDVSLTLQKYLKPLEDIYSSFAKTNVEVGGGRTAI